MDNERRYDVFHRTWWRWAKAGLFHQRRAKIPGAGRRTYIARGISFELACRVAKEYNDSHEPGKLSRKAELEES